MWSPLRSKHIHSTPYRQRSKSYIDRDFQLKHMRSILIMATVSFLFLILPFIYFANKNYQIFLNLADYYNPDLAKYIDKEQLNLNLGFALAFCLNAVFWYTFSSKFTTKLIGPIKILRNHIRLFSRGDFTLSPIHLRDNDEFKDLVQSYNYLFTLLQVQNQRELRELKQLKETITNPMALNMIVQLIERRSARNRFDFDTPAETTLNEASGTNVSTSAKRAGAPGSRHAS